MKIRNLFNGRKRDMNLNIPSASTPVGVVVTLVVLVFVLGALLYWLFGFLGLIVLFVILAFTTSIYTQNVPEFHALTVLNSLTGVQRVVFQGRTGKLPWEEPGTLVDLRTEIKDILEETWATAAGALMEAKYIFMLHPRATPKGILTFAGFTHETVKAAARNLFSMMLSDYFGKCKNPKKLLKKDKINKAVFESKDKDGKVVKNEKIIEFEHMYGVDSSAKLEDVDYDSETQKARDIISKATSIAEAMTELQKVMSKEKAELTVRQLNIPGIQEYVISVSGIPNVRDISVIGVPGGKK